MSSAAGTYKGGRFVDHDLPNSGGEKTARIDSAMAVLGAILPGRPLPRSTIAECCGCSEQAIAYIENRALMKLRNKFLFGGQNRLTKEIL